MSQPSSFSSPADLAAHFRYKTDYSAVLSCRDSLAAAIDAASGDLWVREFGKAVVRPALSFLFISSYLFLGSTSPESAGRWP
jgi:hypothetical protein